MPLERLGQQIQPLIGQQPAKIEEFVAARFAVARAVQWQSRSAEARVLPSSARCLPNPWRRSAGFHMAGQRKQLARTAQQPALAEHPETQRCRPDAPARHARSPHSRFGAARKAETMRESSKAGMAQIAISGRSCARCLRRSAADEWARPALQSKAQRAFIGGLRASRSPAHSARTGFPRLPRAIAATLQPGSSRKAAASRAAKSGPAPRRPQCQTNNFMRCRSPPAPPGPVPRPSIFLAWAWPAAASHAWRASG